MRYYYTRDTLFVRGNFSAASTGIHGGVRKVSTIFNHTVPADFPEPDPFGYLERLIAREGFGPDFFGLLTAVDMQHLCILHFDFIAVFITAGVQQEAEKSHTINIIVLSSQGLAPGAQLEAIITVSGAKAEALGCLGYACTGTPTDAVVIACEGKEMHEFAGPVSEAGKRIHDAVQFGVQEAIRRHEGRIERKTPSMFIFSRYGGDHWVEWKAEGCPYYPCHFAGQRCELCYCPFYPCRDVDLGEDVESIGGGTVWSCSRCMLMHRPEVVDYVLEHPEAPLGELKKIHGRIPGSRSMGKTKPRKKKGKKLP
ncbi:MAG: adenosylcobinamide amidohydrolase [Methanomicrobiales archaeon]|nr:adenosylcobinamide amidohydrolase [Methanomicrobiales archaeon]